MPNDRDLAAEARHGGRYITGALSRALTNDGIRSRFAGEHGPEKLAEIWRYTASPSGADYGGSGRDTTQHYAISAAQTGGAEWEHSAYWQPQPLAESVFDWPIYRIAMAPAETLGTGRWPYCPRCQERHVREDHAALAATPTEDRALTDHADG